MKIKVDDYLKIDNPIGYFLLHSMTMEDGKKVVATLNSDLSDKEYGEQELDVQISVNGVPLNVELSCKNLYDAFRQNIISKAQEIAEDTFNDKYTAIIDELDNLRLKVESINNNVDWEDAYNKKFVKE